MQFRQGAKGFCYYQWGMVGQHDAARSHANALRTTGDMTNQHCSGRARYAAHVVVLSQPVACKAQMLGMLGRLQRKV